MGHLNQEIDLILEQSLFEKEINLMLEQSLEEGPSQLGSLSMRDFRTYTTKADVKDKDEEEEEDEDDVPDLPAEYIEPPQEDKPQSINEDKLTPIVIDFNQLRKQELNESFLTMFGSWIKHILGSMFGNTSIPVSIRGNKREVESFARALGGEKHYLDSARKHGLDHPMTYKNKAKLDNAIKGFEKDTGLKWPFK